MAWGGRTRDAVQPPIPDPDVRRHPLPALLLGLAVTVAACTTEPPSTAPTPTTTTPAAAAPASPSPSAAPAPAPPAAPTSPAPDSPPTRCPADDRERMTEAVRGQLDAIRTRDWQGALGFTSSAFRASMNAAQFERIIVDGFPVVAAAAAADVVGCELGASSVATLLVTVEDDDGTQQDLVYLFELEEDTWRIGGAVPAATPGEDSFTV